MKLYAKDIRKKYNHRFVVDGVSFEVSQGETVGLLGPNGAGKTTSFYMIVGMIKPYSGQIFLDNLDITKMAMYKRAQNGIGYLPQEASVFRKLSIEDNIRAVLEMTKLTKKEQSMRVERLLEEFSLQKIRKSLGIQLSGGERRRTEIARALATEPKFMLLDEPFAGVDPIAVQEIKNIITTLKDKKIGVLITDHNVHETLTIVDRAYMMADGKEMASGEVMDLVNNPMVRERYLGENFDKVYNALQQR